MRVETQAVKEYLDRSRPEDGGYQGFVKSFQNMFDKNNDEFRWVLVRNNRDLGFKVMLDNDQTTVVFSEEDVGEELAEWSGRFDNYVAGPGACDLLSAMKVPNERY